MKNNEYIEISRDIENLLKSESTHTFLILIDILLRSNNETNSLKTSISKIARTFGLDEREVKKSLSRLRKKELIEIYKNQDDKNSLIIALRKDNECYRITSKEFVMDETMIATLSIGRNDKGYAKFRKDVLERDEYTCQICGGNEKLEVHHIKPYAGYKNLRTTVSNGITLCEKCHKKRIESVDQNARMDKDSQRSAGQ